MWDKQWGIHIYGQDIHVSYLERYLVCALFLTLFIRLIMSLLNAWEYRWVWGRSFWSAVGRYFGGLHRTDNPAIDRIRSDFWLPTILGFLELITYPVLLQLGSWTVIGAWIGFKTVAQWNVWTSSRSQFNRYLIGNALVVLLSIVFLVQYVVVNQVEVWAPPG
jgi:hypothetical protein